ncbi:Ataxin-10, putative [Pediculus humanus corporis]|uniref:Ataxin-10 n=1 Tax=Pediculus humanus subsp. corporis TaxID=121224 RepID=E0VLS0_PEDHC|nr:Ataxin-10, putative [Pediculus humanus corporis]EEB14326.1 Ataxin-10, putative [Pediculus humanus corporis]
MELSIETICNFSKNSNYVKLDDVINAFRQLRNLCAKGVEYQNAISKNSQIIENTKNLLLEISLSKTIEEKLNLCLIVGLQFLGNLLVNNKSNQLKIWSSCQDLLTSCLILDNVKIQHCSLMIMYNIFLGNPSCICNLSHPYVTIFDLAVRENSSEYSVFILDLFITNIKYLERFYNQLKTEYKCLILEEIQRLVKEKLLSTENLNSNWILNVAEKKEDTNYLIREILKLFELLICFSSDDEKCLKVLQKETSFFINCVTLLKAVHALKKENENNFKMKCKLSDLDNLDEKCSDNPVFGFKADLIRIIGNMCWKNSKLQDIINELEGIQIILDCCIIDSNNPFITQWSILAIHNICENNLKNQKVIGLMSKQGIIDINQLKESGLILDSNAGGDSICLAPLKIND